SLMMMAPVPAKTRQNVPTVSAMYLFISSLLRENVPAKACSIKVPVTASGHGKIADARCSGQLSAALPIISRIFLRQDHGKREQETLRNRVHERFVHAAQLSESRVMSGLVLQFQTGFLQFNAQLAVLGFRKPIVIG